MRLIYDLETDNLLDKVSKIHCMVTRDIDTDKVSMFFDRAPEDEPDFPRDGTLADGVDLITKADFRIGHNILNYDEVVLQRLANMREDRWGNPRIRDTLIGARVVWPEENLALFDFLARHKSKLPRNLEGRHSLEAWGYRMGNRKAELSTKKDFSRFTAEIARYCVQDTEVTKALVFRLLKLKLARSAWLLEQDFSLLIEAQQEAGFPFDKAKAEQLAARLMSRRVEVHEKLQTIYPPRRVEYFTLKKRIRKGRVVTFNPGSRVQIGKMLMEQGWKPTQFTKEGRPEINETVLAGLKYPGIPELEEYLMLEKRLGAIAEGKGAWLKYLQPDGRIHGKVNHNAAGTGRCTHNSPNLTAVPKAGHDKAGKPLAMYGTECRALFGPGDMLPDWVLVGGDASGLELRMLAHYLAEYDGGTYIRLVTEGDVHTANMLAAGLKSRDDAKTFIYALLYGAGDAKLGLIVGGSRAAGKRLRAKFLGTNRAFAQMLADVQKEAAIKRKLLTLDGRYLHVRSAHSALNTKLQGAGAIVMKLAAVLYHRRLRAEGLVLHRDFAQVHAAHDEYQVMTKSQYGQQVGRALVESITEAGRQLSVLCPLAGEFKIGRTWADTH